jgi:hypothetical protein
MEQLEREVAQDFFEADFSRKLTSESLGLNCFYLSLLNALKPVILGRRGLWLDVGSLDFRYAPALSCFLKGLGVQELLGLEVDPKRLYRNFYRRRDYARYYSQISQTQFGVCVRYEQANFLSWTSKEALSGISCFFPFLFEDLHEGFGLPPAFFDPLQFYKKLFALSPQIIFFHQGRDELEASKNLIYQVSGRSIKLTEIGPYQDNPWQLRKNPVYALVWHTKD